MVRITLRRARACVVAMAAMLVLVSATPRTVRQSSRPNPVIDAPLSTYAQIHSATVPDYAAYTFKFTSLGPQKKSVPSLGGRSAALPFSLANFVSYERVPEIYDNDESVPDTLLLSPGQMKAFVDQIGTVPALTDTAQIPEPNASLMIYRGIPTIRCWEHQATRAQTDQLFQMLRNVVSNPADTAKVSSYRRQMAGVRP